MPAVEVNSVAKTYGDAAVLSDISAEFAEGSFTSLLGPSGSGKTTLLRIIAGFVTPDRGRVTIGGRDVTRTPVWARKIGMVFQSYALFPHMSVRDNVAFGLARKGIRGAAAGKEVERALELVRLPSFGGRKPKELSGGQQQRVALARAIVTRPDVLLLDEPLSALDRRLRQEMQVELLRIQRESGLTTIFVTHDQEEALTLSDTVAILDRGLIVQSGPPADIYERPRTRFAASFLGEINLLTGAVDGEAIRLEDGSRIVTEGRLTAGEPATIGIRPEKIFIEGSGSTPLVRSGTTNRLEGVVTSSIYAGAALTYRVDAGGTTFQVFAQNGDAHPHVRGDRVALLWSAAHTVPIADDH